MMAEEFTPYSTAASLFGAKPSFVSDPLDIARLQSYALYERIYWNVPGVFVTSQRGTDDQPIYIPAGRTIVDTSNRYTGTGYGVNITTRDGTDEGDEQVAVRMALDELMAREKFRAKFLGAKRYGQIQGDVVWHVTADESKPEGSRISLSVVDPSKYFPKFDPDNQERVVAVMLAELVTEGSDSLVRRVMYRKGDPNAEGVSQILVSEGTFPTDAWESVEDVPTTIIRPELALPDEITSIPVYHIVNFGEPGNPFGSSELRGMERLIAALHQTISDEELTLALDGIGMYATTAPHPIDPQTKLRVPWQLGPGKVVHRPPETDWERVEGVSSVTPYGDHYDRIWTSMKWATASPDVAIGTVDVKIAESGIALALQLSPIIAKSDEKNQLMAAVLDQMWFDVVTMWFAAFEASVFENTKVTSTFTSAVPVDRAARFAELNDMMDHHVIDDVFYRAEAAKLGYVFPTDFAAQVTAYWAAQDAFAARAAGELTDNGGSGSGADA